MEDLTPLKDMSSLQRLYLSGTKVADLSPIANLTHISTLIFESSRVTDLSPLMNLSSLERLWLGKTQADLSTLVASGAAWENENKYLNILRFPEVPVADPILREIGRRSMDGSVGAEALNRLRELRDMAPPPAATKDPAPTSPFVFLSYASTNRPAASRLKSALEEEGLSIWWDQMIDPGMDWDAELRRRVTSAHSVLVLWSEASAASEHVRDEAQRARRANTIAPVMIEPLSEDQLPQPFGGRHTLDLSHWDGARDDEVFQRLVKFLKHRQAGADSPLTVDATDDGDIRLRERPVGAAPEREDDVTRDQLIGAQVKLAERTAAQARRAPNAPPDLPDRLDEYVEELKAKDEKFWEVIDDAFAPAAGLLKPEELTDDGLADAARRLLDRHRDLKTYIQPMQPADKPPRKDEVEPEKAEILIPELRATRELAAHPDLPQIGPAIPRVLDTAAEHIEEEAANYPMNDAEAEQRRTRVGRAIQNAKGVATGLATVMTFHSYAFSEAGKALLKKLDKLIEQLVNLLP